MILSQIAAMSINRVIGVNNDLPWQIPEDLKYFKQMTKGKILIMGRKTFESLPGQLPNRYHIVISRSEIVADEENLCFVKSFEEAKQKAKELLPDWNAEVMICGGAEIYKMTLPFVDRIYLTVIEKEYKGDTFFPEFDQRQFQLETTLPEKAGPIPFSFHTYTRNSKK